MEPINLGSEISIPGEPLGSRISLKNVNIFILMILVVVITSGIIFKEQILLGSCIMEFFIFLITLGWIKLQKMDLLSTLPLKLPGIKEIGFTLIVTISGIQVASFIDLIFRFYLQKWGTLPESSIPQPHTISELIFSLVAIAILPAIAEETLFRGFVLRSYQEYLPAGKAIFISSVLFGMAHLSISNFWGPFILGLVCGWLVLKFNSIFLPITAHLLNNALTIIYYYFMPDLMDSKPVNSSDILMSLPYFIFAGVILIWLILSLKPVSSLPQENKGSLAQVLTHWSIWILFAIYGMLMILELLMMRGML